MKIMRYILNRLTIVAAATLALTSCVNDEEIGIVTGGGGTGSTPSTTITPSCRIENLSATRANDSGIMMHSLIDQITTKQLDSNFLRIDEDMADNLDGLYTFTGDDPTTPYLTNWNKAYVLEATIISSPDNTEDIHYRSVSLAPTQQYKMNIVERKEGDEVKVDTTHFYHTRMVGWYPKNCKLPEYEGEPVATRFDAWEDFNTVRVNEKVDTDGDGTKEDIVGLHFKNFNGETDIMVSNVCEAQPWHKYNAADPHASDIHPDDLSNIYRYPFGHNFYSPVYSNYFTYRHYRSAIRVSAYADQSAQSLSMWGEIQDVIIRNQPTSCKIWLPTELNQFGEVYEWGDRKHQKIVRTAMFGNDSNHPEYHEEAKYPISMKGSSLKNNLYLGYSLIEPNRDVELEVHTLSGVYTTTITAHHIHHHENGKVEEIDLFKPGFIYHITLNFQTSGTISAILEREGEERYYDLSLLHEYDIDPDADTGSVEVFKIANCYVIDPTQDELKVEDENGNKVPYDGYCFLGTIVGNGQAGIISSGSQKLYPENEEISPVSAQLLWESELGLITNVELKFGYVRFKVPKGEAARGNAVIAVYDQKDNVLWSWHIWITESPQEVEIELGEGDHHTIKILDRNLGATLATCNNGDDALKTYGLYYQWGRKDPSMGPESYDYSLVNLITAPYYDYSSDKKSAAEVSQFPRPTLKDAIEHPMYLILPSEQTLDYSFNWLYNRYDFLWGYNDATGMTSKTIYDPCPYGYRVPSSELNHIFTDTNGTGQAGTYGYTRTFNSKSLFFPYAGYKGVDVGMTSVSLPWKYVGQKGDYQSSMYCKDTEAGTTVGISHYMHRERIYISKEEEWEELNVGHYAAHMTPCYANRRTAAPVRCVKDQMIGSIDGTVSVDADNLVAGSIVNIKYNAHSYGSAIQNAIIKAEYTTTSGAREVVTVRESSYSGVYNIEDSASYHIPANCNDSGITFRLIVTNEHGLSYSDDVKLIKLTVDAFFLQWNDSKSDSFNNNTPGYAIVGQTISYYVGVWASNTPTSVTIDGQNATKYDGADVVCPDGDVASKSVWRIDKAWSASGSHDVTVSVEVNGTTFEKVVGTIKVADFTLGSATTNLSNNGSTMYVMQNTSYGNTYLTTRGDNTAASTTLDYNCIVTVDANKIKSVAKNQYFNGTNNNVTFNGTGTNYTISRQNNNNYYRISVDVRNNYGNNTTTYYLRQTSDTAVSMGTGNNNRNWYFYPVTFNVPK